MLPRSFSMKARRLARPASVALSPAIARRRAFRSSPVVGSSASSFAMVDRNSSSSALARTCAAARATSVCTAFSFDEPHPATSRSAAAAARLLTTPRRQLERTLEGGPVVHRFAVRDEHVLERELEQLLQGRERALFVPGRSPDTQLAVPFSQRVGEDERALL